MGRTGVEEWQAKMKSVRTVVHAPPLYWGLSSILKRTHLCANAPGCDAEHTCFGRCRWLLQTRVGGGGAHMYGKAGRGSGRCHCLHTARCHLRAL